MDKFRVDIGVRADGIVEVRETIVAEFLSDRHGIHRYIPVEGRDDQGKPYRLDVDLNGVWRDGEPERVDESRKGDQLVWRVGKEETTFRGTHEYVIEYDVRGAVGRFADLDEIYWNVSGEGWDVPLPVVAATVVVPEGVEILKSACYTGAYGSTAQDCTIISAGDSVGFVTKAEGSPMTVAVGFPKGAIAEPPPPSFLAAVADFARAYLPLFLPIVALLVMYRRWKKHGDDPDFASIVAQYESPVGVRPAEAQALLRRIPSRPTSRSRSSTWPSAATSASRRRRRRVSSAPASARPRITCCISTAITATTWRWSRSRRSCSRISSASTPLRPRRSPSPRSRARSI